MEHPWKSGDCKNYAREDRFDANQYYSFFTVSDRKNVVYPIPDLEAAQSATPPISEELNSSICVPDPKGWATRSEDSQFMVRQGDSPTSFFPPCSDGFQIAKLSFHFRDLRRTKQYDQLGAAFNIGNLSKEASEAAGKKQAMDSSLKSARLEGETYEACRERVDRNLYICNAVEEDCHGWAGCSSSQNCFGNNGAGPGKCPRGQMALGFFCNAETGIYSTNRFETTHLSCK
jgi:hypothetical protein